MTRHTFIQYLWLYYRITPTEHYFHIKHEARSWTVERVFKYYYRYLSYNSGSVHIIEEVLDDLEFGRGDCLFISQNKYDD